MVVENLHEIISKRKSKWLEKCISFNTQKRSRAKDGFEKNFYKLFNNAVYGKTMENVQNRVRLELFEKI